MLYADEVRQARIWREEQRGAILAALSETELLLAGVTQRGYVKK